MCREPTAMWHSRVGCILAASLSLLCCASFVAEAQPSTKAYRIGWLGSSDPAAGPNREAADLQQGLRDRGYVAGQNLAIEYRNANGNADLLAGLATELVRLKVDLIVTSGEAAALDAKRATGTIPIVATDLGQDPVKAGLVSSFGRPEGNVTGLVTLTEELWPKRLGLLREIVPKLSRLVVLWNPSNPANAMCIDELRLAAAAIGAQLRPLAADSRAALDRAFADIAKDRPDALAICWDSVTIVHAKLIADRGRERRLPTLAPLREYVEAGALVSFGVSLPANRRRAAYYIDRIFKGAKPADLPVERPTTFELIVNQGTAKSIGLELPFPIVFGADESI